MHYTWKVAEKGFKMAFMMNKLAMILVELFLKNKNKILPKIIVKFRCTLYMYAHYTGKNTVSFIRLAPVKI